MLMYETIKALQSGLPSEGPFNMMSMSTRARLRRQGYCNIRVIHQRTCSILWSADGKDHKKYVIKSINPESDHVELSRICLTNEAIYLASLSDVHGIPELIEFEDRDDEPYIIMPFIEGPTLFELIKTAPAGLGIDQTIGIFSKLCEPLQAVHDAQLVHRDIKPTNIIISENDTPSLLDFGIATHADGAFVSSGAVRADLRYDTNTTMGTPGYIAPEAAQGEYRIDRHADIYSLGVTLYHALTGHLLFEGTPTMLMRCHIAKQPPSPIKVRPGIPRGLADITVRATAKCPDDRFESAHDLQLALSSL
jgi:serine/threonine protein kinase